MQEGHPTIKQVNIGVVDHLNQTAAYSAGVRITDETAVATSVQALRGWVWVVEVAVAASLQGISASIPYSDECETYPDTTGLPVVWNTEGDRGVRTGLPAVNHICQLGQKLYDKICANPLAWLGTALPTFKSVNIYTEM